MREISTFKLILRFIVRMAFFSIALLWPASIWFWWEAWVVILLWTIYGVFQLQYLLRHDPELLAERLKLVPLQRGQKIWDKVIMLQFFVAGIVLYIIPGLDVVRYGWSEPFALWLRVTAMVAHLPCFVILAWVMRENTFLSQVVKIDEKRGHQVISNGPYALVRHPMYTVIIILLFVVPIALGSRIGLIPASYLMVLLVIRTYFEDKTLYNELAGYKEYTKKTRYRLVPGLW